MTDKDHFEREAEKIFDYFFLGERDKLAKKDIKFIAQALRAAYEEGFAEGGAVDNIVYHKKSWMDGFASCREMAAKRAEELFLGYHSPYEYADDVAEAILSLQPSEKTGGAE
jgi:hypothetical protein